MQVDARHASTRAGTHFSRGGLSLAVGLVSAATLILELVLTRIFSVLFFYHFSFFAISLAMAGLVVGGALAAQYSVREEPEPTFRGRLAILAEAFAASLAVAIAGARGIAWLANDEELSFLLVTLHALIFLPPFVASGAFLALALARKRDWISRLYALDLGGAAVACIVAIVALRTFHGLAALLPAVFLAGFASVILRPRDGPSPYIAAGIAVLAVAAAAADVRLNGALFRLDSSDMSLFERWNEHSRVQVQRRDFWGHTIIIDRSAAAPLLEVPPEPDGQPVRPQPWWTDGKQYLGYRLDRPVREAAVIGVGGGRDLFAPLALGAQVDGYEINGILIDLLERDFKHFNAIASRPELSLIHSEARVGIANSGKRYDVIQASLIDTWAATAAGGLVLSENGLYTREGWEVFLSHLSDSGVLTMSRWHIRDAPAETHRLVSLAAAALEDAGIPDARRHVILAADRVPKGNVAFGSGELGSLATILVSKAPFTDEEIARIRDSSEEYQLDLLASPTTPPNDRVIAELLNPLTRARAIAENQYDISAPTDLRPYFFLQLRPRDAMRLFDKQFGPVTEITFNGVRVLVILTLCAIGLILVIVALTIFGLPGPAASTTERGTYRWMTSYFLGIGMGYMLVQLGLHQRLILVVGHPTAALSTVLFTMLLGTGLGSAVSTRLAQSRGISRIWPIVLAAPLCFLLLLPALPALEQIGSDVRLWVVGGIVGVLSIPLGLAFPIGMSVVATTGDTAVQKMWAINGAASIAGSVLAAFVGITLGSGWVLAAALASYTLAMMAGLCAERARKLNPTPE